MMGVKERLFPVGRRWTAFAGKTPETYVRNPRHLLRKAPSRDIHSNGSLSRSSFVRMHSISAELRRYHSSYGKGDGDDEHGDMQERKSAFMKALKGSKAKNGKQKTASDTNPPKTRIQTQQGQKNRTKNTTNQSNTRTPSKKLTLDEFFSNLEKQKVDEFSSKPLTTRKARTTIASKRGKLGKRLFHPQYEEEGDQRSHSARPANMDSFFDEVNAIMNEKEEEQKQPQSTTRASFHASISDLIPPSSPVINNDLDDEDVGYNCSVESWDRYSELLDEVIEGPKFLARLQSKKSEDNAEMKLHISQVVEWLRSRKPLVEIRLPTLDNTLVGEGPVGSEKSDNEVKETGKRETTTTGEGVYNTRKASFREELNAQNETFLKEMRWTRKQYEVATGALVAMGNLCARNCTASPLDVAWCKLKELGYPMNNKDVLHNYLYVASTFPFPKRRTFVPGEGIEDNQREGDESLSVLDFLSGSTDLSPTFSRGILEDEIDLSAEVALCHDFLHEATEQSTGIHVRLLVQLGKANEAEALLEATLKSDDLRLRTYAPIYQTYLDKGDVSSALKLFVKMKERKNVTMLTETYVQLIACIAENGYFRIDSEDIEGIDGKQWSYSTKSGPELFNVLLSELAEHSIEITSASAKRLYNAFQRGFRQDVIGKNLKQLHLLESLRVNNDPAEAGELIVSRVQLDKATGKCPRSGSQLRLINLDAVQKKQFREALLYLVSSSYQERHRNANRTDVTENLEKFGEWLQNRTGKPFTAIVDGPNIAYYMQNFDQGTFNYHQIQFVVDALENMGENVLVVLPKKYTYDRFSIPKGTHTVKQTLSPKEKEIRDNLISRGKACVVPVGSLDDYYWMFASVSMNEEFIPPDNPEGRWPGNRPMLISNDKLRDHKMSLLEPRLFRRWYSNFLVNFTFSAFVNDECTDREIGFQTADFYSREIQGNSVHPSETAWHLPVSDWEENESLCIRIPPKKM